MFFLGAGASVDACLPDVVGLVHKFLDWLQSAVNKPELNKEESENAKGQAALTREILTILQDWKTKHKDDTKIDIEILLDTVEKIENKDQQPLSAFYENTSLKIDKHPAYSIVFTNKIKFSTMIKQFVRMSFSDFKLNTAYLNPLNNFIREWRGLSVFSTNYDVCIEQFCIENGRRFVDGFNPNWNPDVEYQKRADVDLRLYKLHGSITWYRSEGGEYIRSDIIVGEERPILVGGIESVPLILYPGRKLEYIEPVIYMLGEIKRQLQETNYVFVVGYSFKDPHIAKLFRYAASRNRKLIIFLISPSAYDVYNRNLKYQEDEEFEKYFTRSFSHIGIRAPIPSYLSGRVICLNYKFKMIFPLLRSNYLNKLKEAQKLEDAIEYGDIDKEIENWKECLNHYVDCEHIEKAGKIIEAIGWDVLLSKDWSSSFEISIKGLISSWLCNDDVLEEKWRELFTKVTEGFSIDKFIFLAEAETSFSTIPPTITLGFKGAGGNISPHDLALHIEKRIIPLTKNKLSIITGHKSAKISAFVEKIKLLYDYLQLWVEGKTYEKYYELRSAYTAEVVDLRKKVETYKLSKSTKDSGAVKDMISQIEVEILEGIFGGSIFNVD
jgi:SIR2-like domain